MMPRRSTRRRPRSIVAATAVVVLALSALSACSAGSAADVETGNTFVVAIESEADVLDPQVAGGWVSWRINQQIFEPLVTEDLRTPSSEAAVPALEPGLAESWDVSQDGLTYTFHIRQGVTFHDGTALDAEAVEYNFRRMWDKTAPQYSAKAAGQTNFIWQNTTDVQAVDQYTLVVTESQPFSPFLRMLAQGGNGSTAIMSPASIETYGDDVGDHPVGTGPFVFDERIRGERISLLRNDNYWGTKPSISGVVFRPLPDASARVAALRSGDVDMIAVPSPDSIDNLVSEGYQLSEGTPPHVWYLSFNMQDPNMAIKEVRQAINLAIDRDGMADDLLRGSVNPAYGVQAPANGAYVERTDAYTRDIAKAKELLASVGLQGGFTTTLITSVDGSGQIIPTQMAEYLQQNLAEIGIDMQIQTQEWISYLGTWAQGMKPGVGMAQMSWGMTTPYWLYIVTSSKLQSPNGVNVGYYSNPDLDSVMDQAIRATDEDVANDYWRQANDIVTEDAALAPVVNDKAPYVLAPYVSGFVSPSEEWYDLKEVRLEQ
ncbi:ABC transporter substrate-binding protein [Rhodococcus sp. 06-1474-1B]|uniref:ABC transporter substrate-binding protein n=1 Tax=Rhodococcus sp. 06-1474-1B TaxID=2022499 RepID=UPI0020CCFA28|nr:ABC transporter substrate-binding protein [Rhodococcus sp. 06-1474-1B]